MYLHNRHHRWWQQPSLNPSSSSLSSSSSRRRERSPAGTITLFGQAQLAEVCGLDASAQQRCWDEWYERFERAIDKRLHLIRWTMGISSSRNENIQLSMKILRSGSIEIRTDYANISDLPDLLAFKLAIKSVAHSQSVKFPDWSHRDFVLDRRMIGPRHGPKYHTGEYETIKAR